MYKYLSALICLLSFALCQAKLPDIGPEDVGVKVREMMKAHASHKTLTPLLAQRILNNYLEILDANKTYFIASDIAEWTRPSDALLQQILDDYDRDDFQIFEKIHRVFTDAISRRREIEGKADFRNLPKGITVEELKDASWAASEEELIERLKKIRALQFETAAKLNEEAREKSIQRIAKYQAKYEEEALVADAQLRKCLILSDVLKATASALDAHSAYLTPGEANQFIINVQQRLEGIGAQLRDDLNGFTIMKIVEGGPAAMGKQLQVKDRIIAVNREPVVGMDIRDAVELLHGKANSPVLLTVIRSIQTPEGEQREQTLDITVLRGEVVVKEARFKSGYEPFGSGVIGYLKLYSFYQDRDSSSAADLERELRQLKQNHRLEGLILDLRSNAGGLLSQAVAVTGLFIKKGIVVSIKDENGRIQHLRNLEGSVEWEGPLVVLVNRGSASASEIVAQTLKDYGRALVIGDDHTFGKGSYQTFTLTGADGTSVNPQGEYKVTRGRYYTVSGKTPQLTGVLSDVVIPGPLAESEIGEQFAKYPLENDSISPNFDDDLSDVPYFQREKLRKLYRSGLQEKMELYEPYAARLNENCKQRLACNQNYQNLMKEVGKKGSRNSDPVEDFGQSDLQLDEAYNVMKDLIFLLHQQAA